MDAPKGRGQGGLMISLFYPQLLSTLFIHSSLHLEKGRRTGTTTKRNLRQQQPLKHK